jgi:hypothetical protein
MVALPAIGALFVAHLAHQDYERMTEERLHGSSHTAAFVGFMVAFACDMVRLARTKWLRGTFTSWANWSIILICGSL